MNGWLISVWLEDDSSILAFSSGFFQTLQGHFVFGQINAVFFLNSPAR